MKTITGDGDMDEFNDPKRGSQTFYVSSSVSSVSSVPSLSFTDEEFGPLVEMGDYHSYVNVPLSSFVEGGGKRDDEIELLPLRYVASLLLYVASS